MPLLEHKSDASEELTEYQLVKVDDFGDSYEYGPGDKFEWSPFAKFYIEKEGQDGLLGKLRSMLFSFGSSGSRVPYLENRLKLIKRLKCDSQDLTLQNVCSRLMADLVKEIERESKKDAHRSLGLWDI